MENLKINEIPQNPIRGNTWNTSSENFSSVGQAKIDSLKDVVTEIKEMIGERNTLSGRFIKEGEAMKSSINNFLLENAPKGEDDSEFARERSELRKKQLDISELQLNEKIGCWRDISLLKRELREHNLQINEKTSRAEMLEKILTE
ncbi:hypothetical protein KAS08_00505 [Candidatus Pacearchaeota archaeon]|nr:hypothetical protein [Candidatus Pacearchaeota archaeon]